MLALVCLYKLCLTLVDDLECVLEAKLNSEVHDLREEIVRKFASAYLLDGGEVFNLGGGGDLSADTVTLK